MLSFEPKEFSMYRTALSLAMSIALFSATSASADILYNDSWVDLSTVAIQLGNCGGECDAVVLEPDSYPFEVNYVYAIGSGAGGGGGSLVADVWILGVDGSGYPDLDNNLGGVEAVDVELSGAQWFEVGMNLGTSATIDSGTFAIAFCFYAEEPFEPCNYVGLGCDLGPMVNDGGFIYASMGQMCSGFQECIELWPADFNWYTNAALGLDRNWIIRASDVQWSPEQGNDDDDASDDDASDDDASDDDASDDDAGDDDVVGEVIVESIEPNDIDQGDTSTFVITGSGFDDEADVFLGSTRVSQIDVDGGTSIEGVFPAELPAGLFDVCVENPDGGADCKLQALEVDEAEEAPPETSDCECRLSSGAAGPGAALLLWVFAAGFLYRRR